MPHLDAGLAACAPSLHHLAALSLQGCSSLSDGGLAALGCLVSLASLNLSECSGISGQEVKAWHLPSLTCLQLQNCSGLDDAGAAALASLTALRSLNLRQCKRVGDAGLAALAPALRRLTSLSLQVSNTQKGRRAPAALPSPPCPQPPTVRQLSRCCHLCGRCVMPLPFLTQGMGEVSDAGVRCLAQLGALQELELQFGWQFGDEGIAALTALTALSRLDLMYRCVWGGVGELGAMPSALETERMPAGFPALRMRIALPIWTAPCVAAGKSRMTRCAC